MDNPIERLARWLLPDREHMTDGELLYFSLITIAATILVAVVWH